MPLVRYFADRVSSRLSDLPQKHLDGLIAGTAATLLLLNIAVGYPGVIDDLEHYDQVITGVMTDWHPPIMAQLWRLLSSIAPGAATIFVYHVSLHWLGFGLIGSALTRLRKPVLAFLIVLGGAAPIFLFYSLHVYKDVSLASALIAFFGLVFWFHAQGRPIPNIIKLVAAALWLYATLVRANAPFATIPLLLWAVASHMPWKRLAAFGVAGVLVSIPASQFINRHVLGANESGVNQTLQMFDIAGIARHSGDAATWDGLVSSSRPLSECYTPIFWDTMRTARCDNLWSKLPPPGSEARERIGRLWLESIARHPVDYAVHRAKNFNAATAFLVPAAFQCVAAPEMHDCARRPDGTVNQAAYRRIVAMDYVKKNPTTWPVVWLAFGAAMLILQLRLPNSEITVASRFLLVSGLIYGTAYTVVGVAADPRYFYWSVMAVQNGAILALTEFRSIWTRKRLLASFAAILGAIILSGYFFRLSGTDLLIR